MAKDQTKTWRDKCSFMAPSCVTHKVECVDYKFFAINTELLFKLKEGAGDVFKALAVLFDDNRNDTGSIQRSTSSEEADGKAHANEIIAEPISEAVARMRYEQKQKAITDLLNTFGDSNKVLFGEIIMASLLETFPPDADDNPPPLEFIQTLPLNALPGLVMGVVKANKGVLGPLAEQIVPMFDAIQNQMKAKVTELEASANLTATNATVEQTSVPTPETAIPAA